MCFGQGPEFIGDEITSDYLPSLQERRAGLGSRKGREVNTQVQVNAILNWQNLRQGLDQRVLIITSHVHTANKKVCFVAQSPPTLLSRLKLLEQGQTRPFGFDLWTRKHCLNCVVLEVEIKTSDVWSQSESWVKTSIKQLLQQWIQSAIIYDR